MSRVRASSAARGAARDATRECGTESDEHGGGDDDTVVVAQSQRSSRAARPPGPSGRACAGAWQCAAGLAARLEAAGLVRTERLPPVTFASRAVSKRGGGGGGGGAGGGGGDAEKSVVPFATLGHLFSLQRPIDANAREAAYLSYDPVLPLEATQLASAGMWSNSVRSSVVNKVKKTCGGGQQTTRNNLGDLAATWSSQVVSVAIALGAAKRVCRDRHGMRLSDPVASIAIDTASFVADVDARGRDDRVFIVSSTARLLPHALPTRIAQHSLLDTMREFAKSELEVGTIRQRVPQQLDALRSVCNATLDTAEGTSVWAAWILLLHMLSDPRLRRLVQASRVSDMDAATAALFEGYAGGEVTKRAKKVGPVVADASATEVAAVPPPSPSPSSSTVSTVAATHEHLLECAKIGHGALNDYGGDVEEEEDPSDPEDAAPLDATEGQGGQLVVRGASTAMTLPAQAQAQAQAHALKRKRSPATFATVAVTGAGFLEYWQAALTSEFVSILKTMITQSKAAATTAAADTLHGQTPSGVRVEHDPMLLDISSRNAIRSAEAISSLVVTPETRVPKIVAWRARDHKNRYRLHVGIARSPGDTANATIHACTLAPRHAQPAAARGHATPPHIAVLWSHAIRNTTPRDSATGLLPGVVEGAVHLRALQSGKAVLQSRHSRHQVTRVAEVVRSRTARAAADGSLDTTLTGVARGILVLRARLCVSASQVHAGVGVAEAVAAAGRDAESRSDGRPPHAPNDFESCALHSATSLDGKRLSEPYATPASNLGLALQANEAVRVLLRGRSHRGDPCRYLCGVATSTELGEEYVEQHELPQGVLPIVDCKVDFLEEPCATGSDALPNRRDAMLRRVAITLTVCGDAPVRVTDLIDAHCDHGLDADGLCEVLALTHAAAARASELNDVACAVCAGHVNSSIESSRRILVGDLNLRLWLTLYQAKPFCDFESRTHAHNSKMGRRTRDRSTASARATCRASLRRRRGRAPMVQHASSNKHAAQPLSTSTLVQQNVHAGAGFDLGTSGGIGTRASSITADRRNHGKLLMSQDQVDEWCADLAETHYVQIDARRYAAIPRECRGVPHVTVPGLHAYLNDYERAMERSRAILGVEARPTVDSLQALTFGPYADRIAPYASEAANPTIAKNFRNPDDRTHADGRAFMADATCPDLSVFREPLVPSVAITSPQDNIFAQAHPFLASVFGAAAAIARHARTAHRLAHPSPDPGPGPRRHGAPRAEVAFLHRQLARFHTGEPVGADGARVDHTLSASVMVLLNVIFPASHTMAANVVREAYARAPALCAAALRAGGSAPAPALPHLGLPDAALAEARAFWAPFVRADARTNAWEHVAPLLVALLEADGTYDNDTDALDALWSANDDLLRAAAWCVASPDGQAAPEFPSPLAGVTSWQHVRSEHITPIFVGYTSVPSGAHVDARSSLVGVMPMGFQQLLHLLMAAARNPKVVVQYAHNFGALIYRPSAAPDITTTNGHQRSAKSISVVGVDGDEAAFGTRAERVKMCKLHRAAWRQNLDLVKPLCIDVAPPMSDKRRARGDRAATEFIKQQKRDLDAVNVPTKQEVEAAALFERAVADAAADAVRNPA